MDRILAAIDETETSALVIERAVELAKATGGRVRLFRAVALPPVPPPPTGYLPHQLEDYLASERAHLRARLAAVPEELRDGAEVGLGPASDAICDAAKSLDAQLVVIGAHRYGAVARALGTTASRVTNRIDRPVLVVRPSGPAPVVSMRSTEGWSTEAEVAKMRAGSFLSRDHARLERLYERLVSAYRNGDWSSVRAEWDVFEPALQAHMTMEESRVFPLFRTAHPREADALLDEHAELRGKLSAFGVRVELHALPLDEVEALIAQLRAHAACEDRLLYPWVDRNLELGALLERTNSSEANAGGEGRPGEYGGTDTAARPDEPQLGSPPR